MSVPFEGEKYTMLSGLSRLISTLNTALGSNIPPPSWNLGLGFHCFALQCVHIFIGVKAWDELPTEVYHCYLELKAGFRSRFDPTSFLFTDAPLVHPDHG